MTCLERLRTSAEPQLFGVLVGLSRLAWRDLEGRAALQLRRPTPPPTP